MDRATPSDRYTAAVWSNSGMDVCSLSALDMASKLSRGEISARELLHAHLERIERINPVVNALVTLTPETALEQAEAADQTHARGESLGLLHGLPVAHKDLALTAGVRTTFGSLVFADFVPDVDSLVVERQRRAGAVTVGKTNTPEFGAGSHTYNEVFGPTLNPYDLARTCGGSSGGAAVALAARMLPLCDGSDLGGSLRNPAAFCNVVGFRPSPGRVPSDHRPGRLVPTLGGGSDGAHRGRCGVLSPGDGRTGPPRSALDRGVNRCIRRFDRARDGLRTGRVVARRGRPARTDPAIRTALDGCSRHPHGPRMRCSPDLAGPLRRSRTSSRRDVPGSSRSSSVRCWPNIAT